MALNIGIAANIRCLVNLSQQLSQEPFLFADRLKKRFGHGLDDRSRLFDQFAALGGKGQTVSSCISWMLRASDQPLGFQGLDELRSHVLVESAELGYLNLRYHLARGQPVDRSDSDELGVSEIERFERPPNHPLPGVGRQPQLVSGTSLKVGVADRAV